MSNAGTKVRGLQVDPGNHGWVTVTLEADLVVIAQILATHTASQGYRAGTEYWFAYDGAAAALGQAEKLTLQHDGKYYWNDYGLKWADNPPRGRSGDSVEMDTDVVYSTVSTGPGRVFEGTVTLANGTDVTLRLSLSFKDGKVSKVEWFHDGPEAVGYLVNIDALVELEAISATWGSGWRSFAWSS